MMASSVTSFIMYVCSCLGIIRTCSVVATQQRATPNTEESQHDSPLRIMDLPGHKIQYHDIPRQPSS